MSITDPNTRQISGPINVVRMEGMIGKIKKIIYLFMDNHFPTCRQLECEDVFSPDVDKYLARTFYKLNGSGQIYDFFLEIFPTDLQNVAYGNSIPDEVNHREKYIAQVGKLFRKIFKYDPAKNKVSVSDQFQNVRLHYMDIRDYFMKKFYGMFVDLEGVTGQMWHTLKFYPGRFDDMNHALANFVDHCAMILTILKSKPTGQSSPIIKFPYDTGNPNTTTTQPTAQEQHKIDMMYTTYLLDKMFNKYKHTMVKEKLARQRDFMIDHIQIIIKECESAMAFFTQVRDAKMNSTNILILDSDPDRLSYTSYDYNIQILRVTVTKIANQITKLFTQFVHYFTRFMDIFFLRRFLDKDYITHAIAYTGSYHSDVYIEILARDFGFRITHAAYSKYNNLAELNAAIRDKNAEELGLIFDPPIRSQCSNLKGFPPDFE